LQENWELFKGKLLLDTNLYSVTLMTRMDDNIQNNQTYVQAPVAAQQALKIDELVLKYVREIEEIKGKLREETSMFKDTFANDEEYKKLQDEIQVITKKRKLIEEKLSKIPSVAETKAKIQSLKEDMRSAQDMLSAYLEQYVSTYNQRTIEDENGAVQEIIPSYKLVKQK